MDSPVKSLLGFISLSCAVVLLYKLLRFGHRDKRLPPGPPTIPILGNAHQIPAHGVYKKFKEWGDQYGKIFSVKIGAGTIVVLNDPKAIHELISKRSAIYTDRPIDQNSTYALNNENFAFMHATPLWRAQRKIASQYLAPKSIDDRIVPIQEAEICQLVYDLFTTPDAFRAHMKRVTASIAAVVIFGHRAPGVDSFWTTCVYDAMDMFNRVLEPGSYLPIEQFPILKLIPDSWAKSKGHAKQAYKGATAIWCEARERVERRRQAGDLRDSICDRLVSGDLKCDVPLTKVQIANFLGVLHEGAADTTSSMMLTNILWLAAHPWVQEKAQVELDRVCGVERMPTWADFKDLPYINCILKESLRVRPVVPEGLPHRVSRDDWYDGFLIPKDSAVFIPPHVINRACENPDTYNPDRYLNHPRLAMDYAGSPDYENRDHYTYGAGRRICVGIHLAERTQWRIIARVLWAFKLEPGLDEATGKPIELDLSAYIDGFLVQPAPYKVRFTPRSEKHAQVIRSDFKEVEGFLKSWE